MHLIPTRLICALAAVAFTVAFAGCAVAQQGQLTVKIKESPRSVSMAGKCDLLSNKRMVAKCKACVTRPTAHVFRPFKKAGKRCEKAPAPQPAGLEPPALLRNTRACEAHLSDDRPQRRCIACVNRKKPHTYAWASPAGQRCRELAPPPPPAAPRTLRSKEQCKAHVGDRRQKSKCVACVTRKKPHVFDPLAPAGQRCQVIAVAPPPPPQFLRNQGQCQVHAGDRRQTAKCIACVTRKKAHTFSPRSPAGQRCQPGPVPAPRPVVAAQPAIPRILRNPNQCKAHVGDRRQAAKCVACVTRKKAHVFDPRSPAGQRCQVAAATPAAPPRAAVPAAPRTLRNKRQCNAQIANKRSRAKCVACVTRKKAHVFDPNSRPGQRCQPMAAAPAAAVPPRVFNNANQCKTQLHNARAAARCVSCVTRDAPHRFWPEAAAGQRCKASGGPPRGISNTSACKARTKNARDKAKCVACVTRKKRHLFFPAAPAGQRCQGNR